MKKPTEQKPKGADEWRPHTTPGFEVNGLGQLRTKGYYPPPEPTKKGTP